MKILDLVVRNVTGLHARPAKEFVMLAKKYQSDVSIQHGEKIANAKSLISVLSLGVHSGGEIHIEITGEDEDEAANMIEIAVNSGLGEEDNMMGEEKGKLNKVEDQKYSEEDSDLSIIGVGAASGIAIGPIYQFTRKELKVKEKYTNEKTELARIPKAVEASRIQIFALIGEMKEYGVKDGDIFEVHLELLDDPELSDAVIAKIKSGISAGAAWQTSIEERVKVMQQLEDELIAERAIDLQDIGDRVLGSLLNVESIGHIILPDHPVIVVSHDLTPSDTASLNKYKVLGFCTAAGGPTSHSVIIARNLGIPAVVSAGRHVLDIANEEVCILDGTQGTLVINPDKKSLTKARAAQKKEKKDLDTASKVASKPAETKDGHQIEVAANVGSVTDANQAMKSGAEGIGLLRTEFLFLERDTAPTEVEQFKVYKKIAKTMKGLPVIIRTLDIGGDKPLPYIDIPHEDNPFLGIRGIRLCLDRPDLMRQQLRAIMRAMEYGDIRIMFPMVSDLSEWRIARQMVSEVCSDLSVSEPEVGIMVEIPSSALMADEFAQEVDFFSIGTNDLTQYTLAMDRLHPKLAGKADGLHPAVLRLIDKTVRAAHSTGTWVGVCGELASDPKAVPILIGIGVDELSVAPPAIATIKEQIRSLSLVESQGIARQALASPTAAKVREIK